MPSPPRLLAPVQQMMAQMKEQTIAYNQIQSFFRNFIFLIFGEFFKILRKFSGFELQMPSPPRLLAPVQQMMAQMKEHTIAYKQIESCFENFIFLIFGEYLKILRNIWRYLSELNMREPSL